MSAQPGYFDLQVNGYGGIDYHDPDLTVEELHRSCAKQKEHGVAGFLFTVITEKVEIIEATLRNFVKIREQDPLIKEMIPGVHIEGPFISPVDGYRGAHPKDAVRPADLDAMKGMLDAASGLTKLVTLAPEQDENFKVTNFLAKQGIRVSSGHSNASLEQLKGAIDNGLSMYTHLGNGCPMTMHRHDNIIQRALSLSDRLYPMFIADGVHVVFPALKNYLKVVGLDRAIVVTDAMPAAGQGPGRYTIGRWDLLVGEDLVARAPDGSHLVGSAMTMPQAVERLIQHVGLTKEQALQLTVTNPRKAMGMK